MRQYIRESKRLDKNTRYITHYTPGEYIFINIVKFLFFLCVLWPIEIVFWIGFFIAKYTIKAIIWIFSIPYRLWKKRHPN